MPWCEDCAKYWAPSAMREDGSCPRCGRNLDTPRKVTADNLDLKKLAAGGNHEDGEEYTAPWHFKLLVVLLVIYLTWRFVQLFG